MGRSVDLKARATVESPDYVGLRCCRSVVGFRQQSCRGTAAVRRPEVAPLSVLPYSKDGDTRSLVAMSFLGWHIPCGRNAVQAQHRHGASVHVAIE